MKKINKGGRPKKTIDFSELDKLIKIGCVGEECAYFFGIDYDTLNAICKREKGIGFSEYYKKGNSDFKISLRRLQYRSAFGVAKYKEVINRNNEIEQVQTGWILKPSDAMQIFLGKQYLGQADKFKSTLKDMTFSDLIEQAEKKELKND